VTDVWILQKFIVKANVYEFVDVFAERDDAIDCVLETENDWRIQNETETSTEIWDFVSWEHPSRETWQFKPEFMITLVQVK
jgi:hypothetical protein